MKEALDTMKWFRNPKLSFFLDYFDNYQVSRDLWASLLVQITVKILPKLAFFTTMTYLRTTLDQAMAAETPNHVPSPLCMRAWIQSGDSRFPMTSALQQIFMAPYFRISRWFLVQTRAVIARKAQFEIYAKQFDWLSGEPGSSWSSCSFGDLCTMPRSRL